MCGDPAPMPPHPPCRNSGPRSPRGPHAFSARSGPRAGNAQGLAVASNYPKALPYIQRFCVAEGFRRAYFDLPMRLRVWGRTLLRRCAFDLKLSFRPNLWILKPTLWVMVGLSRFLQYLKLHGDPHLRFKILASPRGRDTHCGSRNARSHFHANNAADRGRLSKARRS